MADLARRLPLAAHAAVSIEPVPPLARFVFRGDTDAAAACGAAFGVDLPTRVCRAEEAGARAALWLGPDEWLLLAPPEEGQALVKTIASGLGARPHALVDVSHRQTALDLSGSRVEALLASGCPLDLAPATFPAGMVTRTIYAKIDVVLWRRAPERFHVEVWRSFAPYLVGMLEGAARDL